MPNISASRDSVLTLIGNTPLIDVSNFSPNPNVKIYAKLESVNPSGSYKDRVALAMIEKAEKDGILRKGMTIIEPTSGNTGISLAMISAVKGYRFIAVMPRAMSEERKNMIKSFGGELILVDNEAEALEKAKELAEINEYFMPNQFENSANLDAAYNLGGEILSQIKDIEVFIAGIGTGGTITGVTEVIKKKKPGFKAIAVEPADSPVLSGGTPGPHKIQGIGAGFVPGVLRMDLIDEIVKVTYDDAKHTAKRLAKEEGIVAGISSGAATWAALEVAKRAEHKNKMIVVVIPDTGERYLSTELFQ